MQEVDHEVGVCLAPHDHCRFDVCPRQIVLLDHRGDQAGILPLSTLICNRKSQTNSTRSCVPNTSTQLFHNVNHTPLPDVLVIPTRSVPRISDLTSEELKSLMESVKTVGTVVEKAYNGDSLTVACQVRYHVYESPDYIFIYDLSTLGRSRCRTIYPPRSFPHFAPQVPG